MDLLALETDLTKWTEITRPAVSQIEDLLLVGDFDAACQLVDALAAEITGNTARKAAATAAFERLVAGSMMWHLTSHLRTVDDGAVKAIEHLCHTVGPSVIPALAEALSVEKHGATRQRLTAVLLGFGAAGRQSVERLKGSANPAVRRTAIHLLREFGGSGALPDLTALLDDAEPNIQREAVQAILNIATDEAYGVLERALLSGTDRTREVLMRALVATRDERTAPLFEYIVRNADHRGSLRHVYIRSVESLGTLRASQAVDVLKDALYKGEWWAPFRTAGLRRAVATALQQIGTPDALEALRHAAANGPRGVRAAVRAIHKH
jgi:HEAT repeat protein